MMNEFNELMGTQSVNEDKAKVDVNDNSIDIMLIDEDGFNGYGNTFYTAAEAFDFLKKNDCLE